MPATLNFTNREFAEQTRPPSASFERALADMHEAFARIEENDHPKAETHFRKAADHVSSAITQLALMTDVKKRWVETESAAARVLLEEIHALTGFVPIGDESLMTFYASELEALKAAFETYAAPPLEGPPGRIAGIIPPDMEGQAHLIRNMQARALMLQRVGLLVVQLTMVTRSTD